MAQGSHIGRLLFGGDDRLWAKSRLAWTSQGGCCRRASLVSMVMMEGLTPSQIRTFQRLQVTHDTHWTFTYDTHWTCTKKMSCPGTAPASTTLSRAGTGLKSLLLSELMYEHCTLRNGLNNE